MTNDEEYNETFMNEINSLFFNKERIMKRNISITITCREAIIDIVKSIQHPLGWHFVKDATYSMDIEGTWAEYDEKQNRLIIHNPVVTNMEYDIE